MLENVEKLKAKKDNKALITILVGCGCLTVFGIIIFSALAYTGHKVSKNNGYNSQPYTPNYESSYKEKTNVPDNSPNDSVKKPDLFITVATTFGEVTSESLYKTFNGGFYEFSHPKQWSVDTNVGGGFDVLVNAYNSSNDLAAIYAFSNPSQKPTSVQAFMDLEKSILDSSFADDGLIVGQYITFTPKADLTRTMYLMPFTFKDGDGIQKYGAVVYAEGSSGYVGINFYGSEEAVSKYFYTFINSIKVN